MLGGFVFNAKKKGFLHDDGKFVIYFSTKNHVIGIFFQSLNDFFFLRTSNSSIAPINRFQHTFCLDFFQCGGHFVGFSAQGGSVVDSWN